MTPAPEAECHFCGTSLGEACVRLVPFAHRLLMGCAPQCASAYVAQAVAYETRVLNLPCARLGPLEGHLKSRLDVASIRSALATLQSRGIIVVLLTDAWVVGGVGVEAPEEI